MELDQDIINKPINYFHTDYKLESVVMNLIHKYGEEVDIVIKRLGLKDRPYYKDVNDLTLAFHDYGDITLNIETFREGIFDYLPEGLFYSPTFKSKSENTDAVIKEIKQNRKIEDDARKLFLPFEQEALYLNISSLKKEKEFDSNGSSEELRSMFFKLWGIENDIGSNYKILLNILPFLHKVRGKTKWIEEFTSAYLEVDVRISLVIDYENPEEELTLKKLGETELGIDSVLSGEYQSDQLAWKIEVNNIPHNSICDFISKGEKRNIFEELLRYLVPIGYNTLISYNVDTEKEAFIIDSADSNSAILGFSTVV